MLPALGAKLRSHALLVNQDNVLFPRDVADLGDWNTRNARRNTLATRSCEEEFVIVAAVQGGWKINFPARFSDLGEGDGVRANFRANAAFFTKVVEVGGETVADVDHGGGQAPLAQELSDGDSRLGVKVLGEAGGRKLAPGEEQVESSGRASELAGYIDAVAWFRAGTQDGFAHWGGADDYDIGQNSARRLGNIAAGKSQLKRIGQPEQAREKPVKPALRQISRQRERQKRSHGMASHGGNVAQAAGKAAMADHLGSMPLAAEMDALQAEIGGYERFVSGRDSEGGAVVTNADANRGPALCPGTDAGDDRLFPERQANSIYKRAALSELTRTGKQSQYERQKRGE